MLYEDIVFIDLCILPQSIVLRQALLEKFLFQPFRERGFIRSNIYDTQKTLEH